MKSFICWAFLVLCLTGGPLPAEEVLVRESFESSAIDKGWSWLRESAGGWKLSNGGLQLLTNGDLWQKHNTQENILLRPAPEDAATGYAVQVTVSNRGDLTERYEHGGLIWYLDDNHWVTLTQLNHVQHETQKIMLVHETGGDGRAEESKAVPYLPSRVDLRLVVEGLRFTGYYRESASEPWTLLGSIDFPAKGRARAGGSPRIGPTAGSTREKPGHWVTFDDFSLRRLSSGDS